MNKQLLFENLKNEIETQLSLAIESAKNTLDMATHEENKPENKYDTRGLEASYLARAQKERVLDLKGLRNGLESIKIRNFSTKQPIALTALIKLETKNSEQWFLLLPQGGGQSFKYNDIIIKVITPESPIGSHLVGKQIDDIIELKNSSYSITELF